MTDEANNGNLRQATCSCRQLRVECAGEPGLISLCHCYECQRRTGSVFGVAAFYPRGHVTPQGEAKRFTRSSDTGFDVNFYFCPDCGANVYWETARKPDVIAVAIGAFADCNFSAPQKIVYEEHRHPWVKCTL